MQFYFMPQTIKAIIFKCLFSSTMYSLVPLGRVSELCKQEVCNNEKNNKACFRLTKVEWNDSSISENPKFLHQKYTQAVHLVNRIS